MNSPTANGVLKSESNTDRNTDFGTVLAEARKSRNFTLSDVSEQLKIAESTITALESSDVDALPAATFTQGYIRAYAKFLELPSQPILDAYASALPYEQVAELKPRSKLPDETSSRSPVMVTVTACLILAGIAAIIYGSFQYYQEKAEVMETELESRERSFTGNSLNSPGSHRLEIKQNARMTEEGELIVSSETEMTGVNEEIGMETKAAVESSPEISLEPEPVAENNPVIVKDDVLEIFPAEGSWVQVRDASGARLLYNMIPSGNSKRVTGKAPLRISLGNARTTRLVLNDIEIDIAQYIRANNTIDITVSTDEDSVVFH